MASHNCQATWIHGLARGTPYRRCGSQQECRPLTRPPKGQGSQGG
ncbi:hypothetical protein FOPG_20200 [Fusarium oxysporum f. sp. conglutinans race 2 54008]|uniref:Uncharacterized protein n=1 Tax=Fusarium oxysporum f. sp. conglutinans race 2 54008 TaxID=1089457 RepID=X0GUJ4_FUSOX|nr:hypothetical protein FOPG_20200 [Fusarium oxysporum f. sp. conglutinans race 2 54008]